MMRRIGVAARPQAGTAPDGHWRPMLRPILRQAAALGIALGLLALFADRFREIDAAAVGAAFAGLSAWQWLVAGFFTLLSFWAIGRYDALIHRHLNTGTDRAVARRAGIGAIAISQMAGMGLVTGALVRWRMLPGITLWQALRLTATVALSFLAGWAVVAALLVLAAPGGSFDALRPWAALVLALAAAGVVAAAVLPPDAALARRLALPSLATIGAILGLAALDTTAAAVALWAVLPPGADPGLMLFLPAFLAALGAGLVLATPGGIGPFELALLALLPALPEADLLAGVLAWRVIYFALPAILAMVVLARGPKSAGPVPAPAAPTHAALAQADRAETGLVHQGGHAVLTSGCARAALLVGETRQTLAGLFDPVGPRAALPGLLTDLQRSARARGRMACLYKLSPRAALVARRCGWRLLPVAEEAVIDPARFDLDIPARAALRRKLRRAAQAGVLIESRDDHGNGPLPIDEMAGLAADWARVRGGERGFSMGRFAPDYVTGQRVFLARKDGRLIAFVSFHEGHREWTLDLMRHAEDCPDGTMHGLVARAIAAAAACGVPRLSLAAAPAHCRVARGLPACLRPHLARRDATCGLRRFKASFAPRWQPLYLAAPHRAGLALALADLALHIRHPAPLSASRSS